MLTKYSIHETSDRSYFETDKVINSIEEMEKLVEEITQQPFANQACYLADVS